MSDNADRIISYHGSRQLSGRRLNSRVSMSVVGGLAGSTLALAVLLLGTGASVPVLVGVVAALSAVFGFTLGRAQDKLLASSLTDPLTGLANRRCFESRIHDLMASATRHGFPVALILIDVDRLKQINDRLGHNGGDATMRVVARTLMGVCRSTDVVARLGGDEFAVLAPFTDVRRALEIAERIRRDLPREVRMDDQGVPLTLSLGVADRSRTLLAATDLLDAADRALYAAKAAGRDRIEVALARSFITQPLYTFRDPPRPAA